MTSKKLCAKCFKKGYFSSIAPSKFKCAPPYLCPKCWQSWNTFTNNNKTDGLNFYFAFPDWLGRIWDASDPYGNREELKPEQVIFT